MNKTSKIYIAGHRGLVGSAIMRELKKQGYTNLVTRTSSELDLCRQADVESFFEKEHPDYVFLAAAKVGGILANSSYKAEFIYDNMMIAANVIHTSYKFGVKKLLNLGSSCIYPKLAPQPLKEEYLLSGYLEPTNDAYAIAKISAIKLCQFYNEQYQTNFISAMPTNLYGPHDNFDLETSHVLPALIRKFHEAKLKETGVMLWGDGSPFREFLYSEDLAEATVFLMKEVNANDMPVGFLNIGSGKEITIKGLAELIAKTVGYAGTPIWDSSKPNGTPRKLMDVSKINALGWENRTSLEEGVKKAYQWFLENVYRK